MLNAYSMAGYLNTPEGAVYGFEPLPPEDPILAGFPRTPRTPVGGLFLASALAVNMGSMERCSLERRPRGSRRRGWNWGARLPVDREGAAPGRIRGSFRRAAEAAPDNNLSF